MIVCRCASTHRPHLPRPDRTGKTPAAGVSSPTGPSRRADSHSHYQLNGHPNKRPRGRCRGGHSADRGILKERSQTGGVDYHQLHPTHTKKARARPNPNGRRSFGALPLQRGVHLRLPKQAVRWHVCPRCIEPLLSVDLPIPRDP
jgi:hypothetical protein